MRAMKDYQYGELTKEILKGLAVGGFIVAMVAMPGLAYIMPLFKPRGAKGKYRINQVIKRLHKKKLINIYTKNGNEKGKRGQEPFSNKNPALVRGFCVCEQ